VFVDLLAIATHGAAADADDLFNLSLEELLDIEITPVSKKPPALSDALAAVFVITQSEVMIALELGYRHEINDAFKYDLAIFYNDYDDIVGTETGQPVCRPRYRDQLSASRSCPYRGLGI
jgi:hypothetical protein